MSIEQAAPGSQQPMLSEGQGTTASISTQRVAGSIADILLEKVRSLPPEKQQAVLDYAEFLEQKSAPPQPQRSFIGMFADEGIHITEEEIAEARREMWGNFPREDI
jgi:uncharacterized protein DUF2281